MAVHLDFLTLFLTAGITSGALVLCMVVVAASRRTYHGFGHWTFALVLVGIGMVLIGLRGRIPDFLTIFVANSAILGSLILIYDGMKLFMGQRPRRWNYLIPFAALLLPYLYLTYVQPIVAGRIIVSSTLFAVCSAVILTLHYRTVTARYGRNWVVPAGLILQICLQAIRIVQSAVVDRQLTSFMSLGTLSGLFVIGSFSTSIVIIFGLVILNSQRTEYELTAATAEVKTLRGIVPICASCKKIKDDDGYWNAVESYIQAHTEVEFSHGLCPDCTRKLYPELASAISSGSQPGDARGNQ